MRLEVDHVYKRTDIQQVFIVISYDSFNGFSSSFDTKVKNIEGYRKDKIDYWKSVSNYYNLKLIGSIQTHPEYFL